MLDHPVLALPVVFRLEVLTEDFRDALPESRHETAAELLQHLVGGVFGLEEYRNAEGKKTAIHKLFWFRKADNIEKIEIPKPRLLDDDQDAENSAFDDLVYMSDEDLPF